MRSPASLKKPLMAKGPSGARCGSSSPPPGNSGGLHGEIGVCRTRLGDGLAPFGGAYPFAAVFGELPPSLRHLLNLSSLLVAACTANELFAFFGECDVGRDRLGHRAPSRMTSTLRRFSASERRVLSI